MDRKSLDSRELVDDFDDRPPNQAQFQGAIYEVLSGARQAMSDGNKPLDVAIPMSAVFTVLRACRTDDGTQSMARGVMLKYGTKIPEEIVAAVIFAAVLVIDPRNFFADPKRFVSSLHQFLSDRKFLVSQMPGLVNKLVVYSTHDFMRRVVEVLINPETDYENLLAWKHYAAALFRGMPETIFDGNYTMQCLWAIGHEGIDWEPIPDRINVSLIFAIRQQFRDALKMAKERHDNGGKKKVDLP